MTSTMPGQVPGRAAGSMARLVGHADEIARARANLSGGPPAGMLFVGAAGVGKSALIDATAELASSLGFQVRRSRAAPSEQDLPFVGLHDLIGDAVQSVVPGLPEPLARALDVVLLQAEPPKGGLDVLAVDLAVLEVLENIAAKRPVALVLDDVQWLDEPTRHVLGFALRRLAPERVTVLAAARDPGHDIEALMPEGVERVELGPLNQSEIADLVELRTGRPLSLGRAAELYRLSGGNPFLALELARAHPSGLAGLEQFPVPERHWQVLVPRLASQAGTTRRAVLAAALSSRPTTSLLSAVAGADGVAAAEVAGILHVTGAAVELDHPLLAAAARHEAGAAGQREMHLALAAASPDPVDRARHLARGTVGEDAALADELEAAAHTAAARAALADAAQLARYALEHTPSDAVPDRTRRAVVAAHWFEQAGEAEDARAVLAPVLQGLPAGTLRAECLIAMAEAVGQDIVGALKLLDEALAQPSLEVHTELQARMLRANVLFITGQLTRAREESARAHAVAVQVGDRAIAAATSTVEALSDLCLGVRPEQSDAWQRTRETPWGPPAEVSVRDHPDYLLAYLARGRDDQRQARKLFEGLVRLAQEQGDVEFEANLCNHLTEVALREGQLAAAAGWAQRCWRALHDHAALKPRAHVAAWTGDLDTARQQAGIVLEAAVAAGDAIFEALSLLVLGFTEVSAHRLEHASVYETRLRDLMARMRWGHPGLMPHWQADAVEAFLGTGRVADAAHVTSLLRSQAERLELRGCQGLAAHCEGLIQAHLGDLRAAEDHLERALSLMNGLDMPLDRARTLLALGVVRRRRRQKSVAADALTEAHAIFARAGAGVWADRAQQELRRATSGRAGDELTTGERTVAELAAKGRTNREIAAELYLSPKTVETTLTHVYRKLGVRSRTELSVTLKHGATQHTARRK